MNTIFGEWDCFSLDFNIIWWFNEFYLWINTNNKKNESINKIKNKIKITTINNTFQSINHEVNVFHLWVWFFTNANVLQKTQIEN
jgi:hypothetical protein